MAEIELCININPLHTFWYQVFISIKHRYFQTFYQIHVRTKRWICASRIQSIYSIIYLSEIQQVSVDSIKFLTNINFEKHTFQVLFGTHLNIGFKNEISTTLVNEYRLKVISEWLWALKILFFQYFTIVALTVN